MKYLQYNDNFKDEKVGKLEATSEQSGWVLSSTRADGRN